VLKKALALAHVLLGEGVESLMANLGGRPPAKLASEVARVLPLLLRRVEAQAGGIDEASIASVVSLLQAALTASIDTAPLVRLHVLDALAFVARIDTAPLVRMHVLDALAFVARSAAENPSAPQAQVFYASLSTSPALPNLAECVLPGPPIAPRPAQEILGALQALAEVVHPRGPTVRPFPLGDSSSDPHAGGHQEDGAGGGGGGDEGA
ncbi:hypothetical protein T484DRAFT_1821403, partial [Baffinella frigidus]